MSCFKRVHNNSINILSGFRIIVNSVVDWANVLLIFKNANKSCLRYSAVFENGFHKKTLLFAQKGFKRILRKSLI